MPPVDLVGYRLGFGPCEARESSDARRQGYGPWGERCAFTTLYGCRTGPVSFGVSSSVERSAPVKSQRPWYPWR